MPQLVRPLGFLLALAFTALAVSCTQAQDDDDTVPVDDDDTTAADDDDSAGDDDDSAGDDDDSVAQPDVRPHGVGGGGATSGLSISPYTDVWFIGSDMGILFRSTDRGFSWSPVHQLETTYSAYWPDATHVGFLADGTTMLHAPRGEHPVRSVDSGVTWAPVVIAPEDVRIRFWTGDTTNPVAAYAHLSDGLAYSDDGGANWVVRATGLGEAKGAFLDHSSNPATLYFATESGIYSTTDHGATYTPLLNDDVRWFTGGGDAGGITLAYIDSNGAACDWDAPSQQTLDACGEVHVSVDNGPFLPTGQEAGSQIAMAENDAHTIYAVGGRTWDRAYGTKVWRSTDAGQTFVLTFHQQNWDVLPYVPWPSSSLEWSAVGLDVGWWDGGYHWFEVNQLNSSEIGGSGNFFTHVSYDAGNYWHAAFTEQASPGPATTGLDWTSTGLEVTSARRIEFHPVDSQVAYIENCDIGCQVSTDSAATWRICSMDVNTVYDVAFDPADSSRVFAAAGEQHDWPHEWYANYTTGSGGIFESTDQGRTWTQLDGPDMTRQFLSVAYDSDADTLYAGSQEVGVARSVAGGEWEWINTGLGDGALIVPQIEIDPANGDVYLLLTGDKPDWSNRERTGIYRMPRGGSDWTHLRGTVNHPPDASTEFELWWYPTSFALDLSPGGDRNTLWLSDLENNFQYLATGVWKSVDGGATWDRSTQFTHPYSIDIDPNDPNRVYASGNWNWGEGGPMYTDNNGDTWHRDTDTPLVLNRNSVTVDPTDPDRIYAAHFGGGVWSSPRP